jgi:2-succinyl-5-enolpyruvyl-6-hydroxy-3-cyclohexene-1-carboxylate synthase
MPANLLHLCMDFTGEKSTPYIVDILHQHGVEHVVICPGSRNAPLTLAFVRHGKFTCLSMVDERSAGYFALGMAQAAQKPVAIICTSGTATLNLAPAIAEAFYLQVPLLVLTADRPEAWIHQQDGQAIVQRSIYANIIAKSYSLRGELYSADDLWFTQRITNEAMHIALAESRPVHINLAFAEPLYADAYTPVKANRVDIYKPFSLFTEWEPLLKDKKNILVVIGQSPVNQEATSAMHELGVFPQVVMIAENLANLDLNGIIPNPTEAIYFTNENMQPDVVVYLGGSIVSKQLKKYLTALDVPVIRVQMQADEVDTFKRNTSMVHLSLAQGLQSLADYLVNQPRVSHFSEAWKTASEKAIQRRNEYALQVGFSDFNVFDLVAQKIPAHTHVHFGNSTAVRYAQIFNDLYPAGCSFFSNRGTSGIDGSTSTAAGFSYISPNLNLLICGDLSFQYDANAFFNSYVSGNFKIIVINNGGGNIFRVIDGPRDLNERETYFETAIQHEFLHLARHFNLHYFAARNEKELNDNWHEFIKTDIDRPSVLEIFTDAAYSADTFKNFYQYLQPS